MGGLIGGVEAGGTKFVCGISDGARILATRTIATREPEATLADVAAFFATQPSVAGVGIASFGPIDLDRTSAGYGRILATPKPGWQGIDLPGRIGAITGAPVAIDTDVNAAALAEARAAGLDSLAYITVGTGIGVGIVSAGRMMSGPGHPEAGHLLLRRHPAHAGFGGICPFHGDCLEGLASGPAIAAAWGARLCDLPDDHPAWGVEADYLGQLCAVLMLTLAPARIVIGGGVMTEGRLFAAIRDRTTALLAGYVAGIARADAETRIGPSGCDAPPGLVGAFLLGRDASAAWTAPT